MPQVTENVDLIKRRIDAVVDEILVLEAALRDLDPRSPHDREAGRIVKRIIAKFNDEKAH